MKQEKARIGYNPPPEKVYRPKNIPFPPPKIYNRNGDLIKPGAVV